VRAFSTFNLLRGRCTLLFFFYNNFIAALDSNRGYMNSSELIQACNQAKLHNYKI